MLLRFHPILKTRFKEYRNVFRILKINDFNTSTIKHEETKETITTKNIFTNTYQGHALGKINRDLEVIVNQRQPITNLYKFIEKVNKENLKPDLNTYNLILYGLRLNKDFNLALNVLMDLLNSGLEPDITTINNLLEISIKSGLKMELIKEIAKEFQIELNSNSYELIIKGYFYRKEYEQLILNYERQLANPNIEITYKSYQLIILTYIKMDNYTDALKLIKEPHKKVAAWAIPSDPSGLLNLLRCFLDVYHLEGTLYLFQKAINKGFNLDEGVCLNALYAAARYGDTSLTTLSLQALSKIKANLNEHHFIPILESYFKGGKNEYWERGLYVMNLMSQSNLELNYQLIAPDLFQFFKMNLHLCKELFNFLKTSNCSQLAIYNLLLAVYWDVLDIGRATEVYNYILENEELKLNLTTFNLMLKGIANTNQLELKDTVLKEFEASGLIKDEDSYTQLIYLSLNPIDQKTNEYNYEDAFIYLEEMKENNFLPSYQVYYRLVKTCAKNRDPRAYTALEEMHQKGYNPPPSLRRFIETGGVAL